MYYTDCYGCNGGGIRMTDDLLAETCGDCHGRGVVPVAEGTIIEINDESVGRLMKWEHKQEATVTPLTDAALRVACLEGLRAAAGSREIDAAGWDSYHSDSDVLGAAAGEKP